VSFARAGGVAKLAPETPSAAASIASVYAVVRNGLIEVNHDASAATDRIFGIILVG
jgi:hypothetical protein